MGITTDAGHIIFYMYKEKIRNGKIPQNETIFAATGWDKIRYQNAIEYCINSKYIIVTKFMGTDTLGIQNMTLNNLSPLAINIIENGNSARGKMKIFSLFHIDNFNLDSIIKGELKLF